MLKKIKVLLIITLSIIIIMPLTARAYSNLNWMGSINDTKTLAELSIPGTHDSCALRESVIGTAKCQNLNLSQQLNAGVRYIDIRCRHINDAFTIHHGAVYQHMNFDDVINSCITFLNNNPTECIIMSVKQEHDPSGNTRSFEQTFDTYVAKNPTKWLLTDNIPTLGDARGKIVLLRRFGVSNIPKGIDATNWSDNTTFIPNNTVAPMKIQDQYTVPNNDTKWSGIKAMYEEAKINNSKWLYINYTSGYKPIIGIPSITSVSKKINPQIKNYFTTNTSGRFGITAMDFVDEATASLIIATNNQ